MNDEKTIPQHVLDELELVQIVVRVPRRLREKLQHISIDVDMSQQAIIQEALEQWLAKKNVWLQKQEGKNE